MCSAFLDYLNDNGMNEYFHFFLIFCTKIKQTKQSKSQRVEEIINQGKVRITLRANKR